MSVIEKIFHRLFHADGRHGYTCDCCGEELFDYPAERICKECLKRIEFNDGEVCPKCGRKAVSQGVCTTCKRDLPLFTIGISPLTYRGETASLVNRIKNGNRRLAFYFAEQMTAALLHRFPLIREKDALIVPVPLTDDKRRERGYNQAEVLSSCVRDCLLKEGVLASLDFSILEKKRDESQQKDLTVKQRSKNATGAYHLHKRKVCQGKTILLVDDILTTGATGSACAKLLVNAHAEGVILLTVASLAEQK